jgi:hypothetical protein
MISEIRTYIPFSMVTVFAVLPFSPNSMVFAKQLILPKIDLHGSEIWTTTICRKLYKNNRNRIQLVHIHRLFL